MTERNYCKCGQQAKWIVNLRLNDFYTTDGELYESYTGPVCNDCVERMLNYEKPTMRSDRRDDEGFLRKKQAG